MFTLKQETQIHRTLAVTALAACVLVSVISCSPGTSSVPGQKILDLINEKRVAAGCSKVSGNKQLRIAAERHAVDMRDKNAHLQSGTDGHTGSDGSRPEDRIKNAGFTPLSGYGEVIYWSTTVSNETATFDWWMNSPPHKTIILDCQFTHAGVGLLYPEGTKWYAVVDFAKH